MPEKPDWVKYYEDKVDAVTHKVNWGFFYNGIGDSRRAIDYLAPSYWVGHKAANEDHYSLEEEQCVCADAISVQEIMTKEPQIS